MRLNLCCWDTHQKRDAESSLSVNTSIWYFILKTFLKAFCLALEHWPMICSFPAAGLYTTVRLIFKVVCAQWVRNRGKRWLRKWNTMADGLVVTSVAWRNSEAISFYIKQVTLAHQQQPILVVQTNLANHNVGRDPVLRQKEILESKGKREIKKKGFEDREKFRNECKSKYRTTERSQERNKLYKIWARFEYLGLEKKW